MADLNRAQQEAVTTLSGPLLVLAGAGSGKTRVITFRIAQLIRHGAVANRILAVTFTNKAAREMKERAMGLLGRRKKGEKGPEISTFHSLCVRILRRHATTLGYPAEFAIYDRGDQETLARNALRDIRVGHEKLRPGDLLAQIGNWKNLGIRAEQAEEIADKPNAQLAAMAYVRYQAGLRASGAMDFDDLLLKTEELFDKHPEARYAEASRFDHLLVDEYQDTNNLQYRIMRALGERHRNVCVVGDDDQSIYGWRGAEVAHILNFSKDWPEAKIIRLEENYRSLAPILEYANTLIAHNSNRHGKVLRATREGGSPPRTLRFEDEVAEAETVVREIQQRIQGSEHGVRTSPSDIAVLFRTNEQPRAFEVELRRARVPYVLVGGMSFYDRKEIKDVLSYLRVLANPADEVSLLRIINTPARGIGTGAIETMVEKAVEQGIPLWQLLPQVPSDGDIQHHTGERVEGFRRLMESYRARLGTEPLAPMVSELMQKIEYKSELERVYKNAGEPEARMQGVEEFVNSIALYEQRAEQASLLGFLEEVALSGREDEKDDDKRERHAITLMTLHSAKGLEFPHVYMVGMEEGILPHGRSIVDGRSIDEERRLAYVGVTRAQETLTLTFTRQRMKWGKPKPSIPSRFLMEMRGETERAKKAAEAATLMFAAAANAAAAKAEAEAKKKKTTKKRALRRS
ncbi:MAG TPA: UvrD-helicase domain-containing protein [Polyangiaceae bacterium]|nr:UvrD-helicase domain-containing protein [Polyangiaceae bacterium]